MVVPSTAKPRRSEEMRVMLEYPRQDLNLQPSD